MKRKTDKKSGITNAMIIILIGLMISMPVISMADSNSSFTLAVDFTATQDGEWHIAATWGGGGFPGTGDTWQIPAGRIVNITGSQAGDTGWVNGTLMFNSTTSTATLTLDNGATLTNGGMVNATGTTAAKTAEIIGASLELFTGDPTWDDDYWNVTEINFTASSTTGGSGCTIELFENVTFNGGLMVTVSDTVDGNDAHIRAGNDFDSSGGTFTFGTTILNFTADSDLTSAYTDTETSRFYSITIGDDVTVAHQNNIVYSGVLTIGSGSANFSNPTYLISTVSPSAITAPVILGNPAPLDVLRFQYSTTGVARTNIGGNQSFGTDVWLRDTGTSTMTMSGTLESDSLSIASTAMFSKLTLDTGADYGITTSNLSIAAGGFFELGELLCNGATLDIGSDGIILYDGSDLDMGTALIQTDGDFYIADVATPGTSTVQFTDNASIIDQATFSNITIDVGKTVTTFDSGGGVRYSGLLIVNGTLDTVTNGDYMNLNDNTVGGEIVRVGPSGDISSADFEIWGDGAYTIPEATYNKLSLEQNNVGTNQYVLTGDIIVTTEFSINALNDPTRIIEFFTDDYNITSDTLVVSGSPGATNVSFNASVADIDTSIIIGASGILNGNTSTINLAGIFTNSGTFDAGTSSFILDGAGVTDQGIASGGDDFYNLEINNTHATADIVLQSDLIVTNIFTMTDGTMDTGTNNPAINTTANVTISAGFVIVSTGRTANWTFDGDTNYTDSTAATQNLGNITVSSVVTLNSNITLENYTSTGNVFPSAYTFHARGNFTLATASNMEDATLDMNGTVSQSIIFTSGTLRNLTISNSGTGNVTLSDDLTIGNITTTSTTCTFNLSSALNLTITGDVLLTSGTNIDMGTTGWNISGALNQSITSGGHIFPTMNITNSDANITFADDTNITTLDIGSGSALIFADDMTVGTMTVINTTMESSNLLVDRFLFVPLASRTITNTTFDKVNLIPAVPGPPGMGAIPEIPEEVIDTLPEETTPGAKLCTSTILFVGAVCIFGGIKVFKFIKDPRRKR